MTHRAPSDAPPADTALGLYVHVPFCRSKCRYCDFRSHTPAAGEMDFYLRAVEAEVRLRATDRPVSTLYFGGGTPSFLGSERLSALLQLFRSAFRLQPDCEITVEANPADVTDEWLAACRAEGVNRLSLGVQGMRDEDLRFLERRHTVAEAVAAGQRARAAGFDNLGIDLIVGLPAHSRGITKDILTRAVAAFSPEHLSCYQLTCAPGTRLHEAVQRCEVRMPDADTEAALFMTTHETCEALGYEGYEVSNFARKTFTGGPRSVVAVSSADGSDATLRRDEQERVFAGPVGQRVPPAGFARSNAFRSRHNSAYWAHRDYLGFGPSAHSFMDPVRAWNTDSLAEYGVALERGKLPWAGEERLTLLQRAAEIILLGLRTRDGFSVETLRNGCGFDLLAEKAEALADAVSRGLLRRPFDFAQGGPEHGRKGRHADRIAPTLAGMALADHLAVALAPDTAD